MSELEVRRYGTSWEEAERMREQGAGSLEGTGSLEEVEVEARTVVDCPVGVKEMNDIYR